jgi:glycine/D-amino acid oxidase-like deaminating enzyme
MASARAGAVIAGGGVIGSSVAYHLKAAGFRERVVVLERDPSYRFASSRLAFGGIRQQFCAEVNVRLAQASVAFYERFDQTMAVDGRPATGKFRQRGYLFLAGEAEAARLEARVGKMRALGVEVEAVTPEEMRRLVPEMEVGDVVLGAFGRKDGYGDAPAVLAGFRAKAESLGVEYVADEIVSVESGGGRVGGAVLRRGGRIETPQVVCAAGAFSAAVGRAAGLDLPVLPVRQQLVRAVLPRPWSYEFPVVIDPTGVHWRSAERNAIVIAKTEGEEPPGERFEADPGRFERSLLPVLARRVPEFAGLTEAEAWAGLYEMTPDHNGIVGEHPELPGFHLACGFSGHGLMMAPATGRSVAEAILGLAPSIDVSALSIARFTTGNLLRDEAMI